MNDTFEGLDRAVADGNLSRRQMLWLMATASGGIVLSGCAVNPVTGKREFSLMGQAQEVEIDRQHSPHQFSADYGISQDAALRSYVASVGRDIARVSHRPDMPYSFNPVNANYINAYAFPGGTIGVTRGIMLEMDSEAELSALLGHEVAHVTARHTAQRMSKQQLTGLVLAGAGAVVAARAGESQAALAMGLGGVAAGLLLARYSREDERQADSLGMEYMAKAGQNPEGMVKLMDLLRAQSSRQPGMLEQMFSSHPMSDERYANMKQEQQRRYAQHANRSLNRERYMDNTAALRRLKPAIELQQQAETALRGDKFTDAEQLLARSLERAPQDYTGLVLMAKTLMIQEKNTQARPYLDRAIAVYPEEAQAHHLAGVASLHAGQPGAALERFQSYDQLLPGNPNTRFFIGLSHEGLGERDHAAQAFREYLQMGGSGQQADYARQRLASWQG